MVAENGFRPRGKDRRHPTTMARNDLVPYGVDASVQGMQAPTRNPVLDCVLAQSQIP